MAKPIPKRPNVIIPDPETDDLESLNDENEQQKNMSKKYIPVNKKGEPIPQEKGKGRKECPSCHCFIPPTSEICPNPHCKHEFAKGEKAPKGKKAPKNDVPSVSPIVALLTVLKGRGWEVSGTKDIFDETSPVQYAAEKKVAPILEYASYYNKNGRFELPLDEMLRLLGIPPKKG